MCIVNNYMYYLRHLQNKISEHSKQLYNINGNNIYCYCYLLLPNLSKYKYKLIKNTFYYLHTKRNLKLNYLFYTSSYYSTLPSSDTY